MYVDDQRQNNLLLACVSCGVSSCERRFNQLVQPTSSTELVLKDMSMAPATVPHANKWLLLATGLHATVADRSIVFSMAADQRSIANSAVYRVQN